MKTPIKRYIRPAVITIVAAWFGWIGFAEMREAEHHHGGGTIQIFDGWSNGGGESHDEHTDDEQEYRNSHIRGSKEILFISTVFLLGGVWDLRAAHRRPRNGFDES